MLRKTILALVAFATLCAQAGAQTYTLPELGVQSSGATRSLAIRDRSNSTMVPLGYVDTSTHGFVSTPNKIVLPSTDQGSTGELGGFSATVNGVQKLIATRFSDQLDALLPDYSMANLGVKPDTGVDVSQAIVNATKTLPATGARLRLACGTYLLSSTALVTNSYLHVQGGGQNCTRLRTTAGFTTGDVFKFTGLNSGISDVAFEHVATDTNAVRTSGFTVNLANGYGYVRNVSMRNCFVCLRMGAQAGWNSADHVMLQYMADGGTNPGSDGILVENDVVGPANWINRAIIMSNFIDPTAANRRYPTFAVKLSDTGETVITDSDYISNRTNLLIQPSNVAFLVAGGSGHAVNDTLTLTGGTLASGGAAMTIKVTAVNANGAVTGFTVATPGGYTAVPNAQAAVSAGGSGYAVGDTLTPAGGTLASGGAPLTFTVKSVSSGAVTSVGLNNGASYTVSPAGYTAYPTNPVSTTSSGSGTGAKLTIGNTTSSGSGTGAAFITRVQTVQATRVNSTYLDSAQRDNGSITPVGSGYVFDTGIYNSWITNTNASDGTLNTNGFIINGAGASLLTGITSPVMNTRWSGGLIASTTGQGTSLNGSGFVCADASPIDTSVTGAMISGWGVGIDLAPGCGHFTIGDNGIGAYSPFNVATSARTNGIGLRAQGGAGNFIVAHDNRFFGNTVAAVGFNATGRNNVVHDNPGYNPVGPSNVTVTASPMPLPAGPTTTTYFVQGGASVIVRDETNSITFGTSGGQFTVPAGGIYQLLYSTAPTVSKMIH
ncbi:hypothetical protein MKK70_21165 [Methylobacterium sp. E-041]|uniref:hypothetical protein n=1 Tax=Methylobacterium sp. E-041 TaxID=2836573 RepID=UPI001FBBD551|nr:hypothetical protein [Methylobacterium sp. E-041]MCJ2107840.1 hypothetical protein [Methylobacterium sp. E-041]